MCPAASRSSARCRSSSGTGRTTSPGSATSSGARREQNGPSWCPSSKRRTRPGCWPPSRPWAGGSSRPSPRARERFPRRSSPSSAASSSTRSRRSPIRLPPTRARVRSPGMRAPSSSPDRSISSWTSRPSALRVYHGKRRRAAERLRPRGDRALHDHRDRVWRRVVRRKDSVVTMRILLAQTTTTTEDDGNPLDFVGDFFDSEEWLVIRNVTLFFLVVFWLASAYWVYKDARRRIEDPWLLAMAVALGLFP